jgi:aspartyl aminopeptidase
MDQAYYFRLSAVSKHAKGEGYCEVPRGTLTHWIRNLGGGSKFFNISGSGVSAWSIPDNKEASRVLEYFPSLGG